MTDDRYMTASGIVVVWPGNRRSVRARIVGLVKRMARRRHIAATATSVANGAGSRADDIVFRDKIG